MKDRAGVQIQSVARAIEILNCFHTSTELGISDISAELDLNKSTVFGLVNTLTRYDLLEQTDNKKYRLGMALFEYGNLALSRIDIREETKKVCSELVQKYPTTLHIATQSAGEVVYLDKIENDESLMIRSSNVGRRAPMYCTGVGKAMLAFLPETYLQEFILSQPMKRMTPNTITTEKELREVLSQIRKTGVALDAEEVEAGLTCVAAPIFQQDGMPEIAVSLSFPYGRIEEYDIEEIKQDLLQCTKKLSKRLGYRSK